MRRILLSMAIAACVPAASSAADWVLYADAPNGDYYYDAAGMETDNGMITVWSKLSLNKDAAGIHEKTLRLPDTPAHVLMRSTIDCRRSQRRDEALSFVAADGTVLRSETFDGAGFDDIPTESVSGVLRTALCPGDGTNSGL